MSIPPVLGLPVASVSPVSVSPSSTVNESGLSTADIALIATFSALLLIIVLVFGYKFMRRTHASIVQRDLVHDVHENR